MPDIVWTPDPARTDLLIIDDPVASDDHLARDMKVLVNQWIVSYNKSVVPPHKIGWVKKIHRIYPPAEGTGEREVLFLDSNDADMTAYEVDGKVITVSSGW